jgi:hypothetical protein
MLTFLIAISAAGTLDNVKESARAIVISERVGPEIDSSERSRFHLFPGVSNFRSADFRRLPDGSSGTVVRTDRAGRLDSCWYVISSERLRKIAYYIDNFDSLVPRLADFSDSGHFVGELWQGIGDQRPRPPLNSGLGLARTPLEHQWIDGTAGLALGLGLGSGVGIATGAEYLRSRADSVPLRACLGTGPWQPITVAEYRMNPCLVAGATLAGGALVGLPGYLLGLHRDRLERQTRRQTGAVVDYDLFGDPIFEAEVRSRMLSENRRYEALLGGAGGTVVGAGLGLLVSTLARNFAFRGVHHDSIEISNSGFAFDIPFITIWLGSLLEGVYEGYRHGEHLDHEQALETIRRRRAEIRTRNAGDQ